MRIDIKSTIWEQAKIHHEDDKQYIREQIEKGTFDWDEFLARNPDVSWEIMYETQEELSPTENMGCETKAVWDGETNLYNNAGIEPSHVQSLCGEFFSKLMETVKEGYIFDQDAPDSDEKDDLLFDLPVVHVADDNGGATAYRLIGFEDGMFVGLSFEDKTLYISTYTIPLETLCDYLDFQ